ncbi:MAG TPA: pilin, partial [Patescibacteria group bacterium]|nr:pilin [Patescibacteria group bacterium]
MLKKLNKKKIFVLLFLAVFFFLSAHSVWAQPDVGREYAEETGLGDTDPREILVNFVNIAFTFLAIVAVIIIIYAGYLWMTSGGNSERIEKAKKVLLGAVIGLILILSSFAIVNFIINSGGRAISDRGGGISESTGILPGGERGAGAVSCDSNNLTSACETDHEICGKYGYCDSQAGCICQTKSDVGGSCNQSSDSNVCEPADFMCLSDVCGEDCTCISSPVIYSVSPVGGF